MLTDDERMAVCDCVADFATRLLTAATVDEQSMHDELDIFFGFFCRALEIAKRDGWLGFVSLLGLVITRGRP